MRSTKPLDVDFEARITGDYLPLIDPETGQRYAVPWLQVEARRHKPEPEELDAGKRMSQAMRGRRF